MFLRLPPFVAAVDGALTHGKEVRGCSTQTNIESKEQGKEKVRANDHIAWLINALGCHVKRGRYSTSIERGLAKMIDNEHAEMICNKYSKGTILDAFVTLAVEYSKMCGMSESDVIMQYLTSARTIPEQEITDDICKQQAYQDYMQELKVEPAKDKDSAKIVIDGDVFITVYKTSDNEH